MRCIVGLCSPDHQGGGSGRVASVRGSRLAGRVDRQNRGLVVLLGGRGVVVGLGRQQLVETAVLVGDLVAGTWVVQTKKADLSFDLGQSNPARGRRVFSDAALSLYGVYELQTLEEVLRVGQSTSIASVARVIRERSGMADDGDDYGFLQDYYAALCARLEAGMLVGRRRADKFDR